MRLAHLVLIFLSGLDPTLNADIINIYRFALFRHVECFLFETFFTKKENLIDLPKQYFPWIKSIMWIY